MGNAIIPENTTGTTGASIRVCPASGTLPPSLRSILAGSTSAVPDSIIVAEAEAIIGDAYLRSHYEIVPKRTVDDLARIYEENLSHLKHYLQTKTYVDIDPSIDDEDDDGGDE